MTNPLHERAKRIAATYLSSEPEKAISEFSRVVKKGGIVVIGDEGFSPDFPEDSLRAGILKKMNPGFRKNKLPVLPDSLERKSLQWFFGGCLYLIVAIKK